MKETSTEQTDQETSQTRLDGKTIRTIEKSFTVEPSQESRDIAEAFGIESGHEKTVVDVEIPEPLPQVTYITGESGCGKTTLMRELGWSDDPPSIPDGPLYSWADDENEALRLLSQVGLGDATLFVSRYAELSDSQQYRAKLYLELLSQKETIFLDEFLSTLDRMTAKPVAYVFQKVVRRLDRRIVVSTAHSDLAEYLQPDMMIEGKAFPSRWDVTEHLGRNPSNPFIDELRIEEKDSDWYSDCSLAELHYKGKHTGGIKDYWACFFEDKLVGLLIGTFRMHDEGRRISRVVTHPSYRSIGIGQYMIRCYLQEYPTADTVAAMARYNPVFDRAGMERVDDVVQEPPSGLKSELEELGFDTENWFKESYCDEFMQNEDARKILSNYPDEIGYFITPGGTYPSEAELQEKVVSEPQTAGRVLWNLRPKRMAKFVGPDHKLAPDGESDGGVPHCQRCVSSAHYVDYQPKQAKRHHGYDWLCHSCQLELIPEEWPQASGTKQTVMAGVSND